ncbi:porin family protein [Sphingobacterium sp.]|uniref:porin family protein n=1 Tax=Sphingobacterium sp. TaxID=341027 RepID=UPI0031DB60CF
MTSRKKMFAVLWLTFVFASTYAQSKFEIGISGGYTHNVLTTTDGYRVFTNLKGRSGFQLGIPVRYNINEWFAVQAEPSYIQKNYKLQRNDFFEGVFHKVRNGYFQLPLIAHFSFGGSRLRGFMNAGGFAAYWGSSQVKGATASVFDNPPDLDDMAQLHSIYQIRGKYEYDEKYSFDKRRDKRLEFGLIGGMGIEYKILERYKLVAEGRYNYGLSDNQKDYMLNQISRYNNTLGIQIGVLYQL